MPVPMISRRKCRSPVYLCPEVPAIGSKARLDKESILCASCRPLCFSPCPFPLWFLITTRELGHQLESKQKCVREVDYHPTSFRQLSPAFYFRNLMRAVMSVSVVVTQIIVIISVEHGLNHKILLATADETEEVGVQANEHVKHPNPTKRACTCWVP